MSKAISNSKEGVGERETETGVCSWHCPLTTGLRRERLTETIHNTAVRYLQLYSCTEKCWLGGARKRKDKCKIFGYSYVHVTALQCNLTFATLWRRIF